MENLIVVRVRYFWYILCLIVNVIMFINIIVIELMISYMKFFIMSLFKLMYFFVMVNYVYR